MSLVRLDFFPAHDLNGTSLFTMTEEDDYFMQIELRPELGRLGGGVFTAHRRVGAAMFDNGVFQPEVFVRVNIPQVDATKYIWGFFLDLRKQVLIAEEEGTERFVMGGPGPLFYLSRAILWDEQFSGSGFAIDRDNGVFNFDGDDNAGQILIRLINEDIANTLATFLPDLTYDFTGSVDSAGAAWSDTVGSGFSLPIGEPYLAHLWSLQDAISNLDVTVDLGDIGAPTFELRAWQALGVDRSTASFAAGKIYLKEGENLEAPLEVTGTALRKATHALVRGADSEWGRSAPYWDPGEYARAVMIDYPNSNSPFWLNRAGERFINRQINVDQEFDLVIRPGFDELNGYYFPGPFGTNGHFWYGDTVTIDTGAATSTPLDFADEEHRVTGFRMELRDAATDETDELAALSWNIWVNLNHERGSDNSLGSHGDGSGAAVGPHKHPPNPRLCPRAVDIISGLTDASLKASSENTVAGTLMEHAVDGDPDTRWSPAPAGGPAEEHWWAADVGTAQTAEGFRYALQNSSGGQHPDLAIDGTLYGSNDAGAWSWLPTGKLVADPAANDWTVVASWEGLAGHPDADTGIRDFDAASYRYWLFRCTQGGTDSESEFDATAFEIWSNPRHGHSVFASRCDHGHAADEISEQHFGNVQAAISAFYDAPGLSWFNVRRYGATGSGVADDTEAVDRAIDAMIAAGGGRLYFPEGTYLCSQGLTSITVPAIVMGDGVEATTITCSSATANLFTSASSTRAPAFRDMRLRNTHATPTAGSGIRASSGGNSGLYTNLRIVNFWTGIRHEDGAAWAAESVTMNDIRKYGFHISNASTPDEGDWMIDNCTLAASTHSPDAAIRIDSSGGGKITNFKAIGSDPTTGYNHGIDLAIAGTDQTSILLVANSSFENLRGDALHATQADTALYTSIIFAGNQVSLPSNNSGKAVSLVAEDGAGLKYVVIANNIFTTNGTARSAIQLTNADQVTLVGNELTDNFTSLYTSSGSTNITEVGGSVGDLDDLGDVTITSATLDDDLRYNGSAWANDSRKWEAVTNGEDVFVWEGDALVHDWST